MATNDVSALQFKFDTTNFDANKSTEKMEEKPAQEVTVPVGQQISEAKSKVSNAIKNNNSLSSGLAGSGISSETSFNDKLYDIADVPDEVKQDSGFKSFMSNLWGTKKAESTKENSKAESTANQDATAQTDTGISSVAMTQETASASDVKPATMSEEKISELSKKVNNGGTLTTNEEKALTASIDEQMKALDADFAKDFPDFKPDTSKLSGAKVSDAAESTGVTGEEIQTAMDFTASHQAEVNNGTIKDCADFKNLPANVQSYALKQYATAAAGKAEN